MHVQDGVMVGPVSGLQDLTCQDCGGLVKWNWRRNLGRWESNHRCDFQDTRVDYIATPVVFQVEVAPPRDRVEDPDDEAHRPLSVTEQPEGSRQMAQLTKVVSRGSMSPIAPTKG
jgi:hypothetical protein